MSNGSIPQGDGEFDFDDMLRDFTANGEDGGGEDGGGESGTDTGADAPSDYWRRQLHTLGEFLRRPRKQWLVDKLLGVGDFVMLYGESGHGKTHAALDLAYSCATGRTFADAFAVARPLTVAYCTGEGTGGLADRLRAVSSYYGTQDVSMYVFPDIPQLFNNKHEDGALAFLASWQAMAQDGLVPAQLDVLIMDTLHNATTGGKENDGTDNGVVLYAMRRLREALGCAIILIHHANKRGESERGHTSLRASMDTMLRATKSNRMYTLSCEKLKDGESWAAKSFDLVAVSDTDSVRVFWQGDAKSHEGNGHSRLERRILAELDAHAGQRYTVEEMAQAIDEENRTSVQNTLKALDSADSVRRERIRRVTKDGKERNVFVYWRESQSEVP